MSDLKVRYINHKWNVTLDGHDYRVTYWETYRASGGAGWQVYTSHTDRLCDPDKPTAKRVLAAMQAYLGGQVR